MKKRITAAATISSRTTSGQNIPKITASTAAGIHPKANPKKPYVSAQNPHTPTNVAAAVIQVPTSYQSRMSATLVIAHLVLKFPRCDIFFGQFVARQIPSPSPDSLSRHDRILSARVSQEEVHDVPFSKRSRPGLPFAAARLLEQACRAGCCRRPSRRADGAGAEEGTRRGTRQAIPYRRSPPPHVPRLSRGSRRAPCGLRVQVVARHVDRRHGQERHRRIHTFADPAERVDRGR